MNASNLSRLSTLTSCIVGDCIIKNRYDSGSHAVRTTNI
jgi:hypothetical protein